MEWRLFADLAERADTRRVSIDPGPEATVREALAELFEAHPGLEDRVMEDGRLAPHLTLLVDGDPIDGAELDQVVAADAELALFPPVSGG
jgi:molybdopterin synthase sulfur carrier subunit